MARRHKRRLKPWQRFIKLGDQDLLAFALLYQSHMIDRAYYHAQ